MAAVGARLHRTGSVFSRINDLVKSGVIAYDDRPLWLDVYKAFPPIREPTYLSDPKPDELGLVNVVDDVRPIFYHEDWARATYTALTTKKLESPFIMLQNAVEDNIEPAVPSINRFVALYMEYRKEFPELSKEDVYIKASKKFEESNKSEAKD